MRATLIKDLPPHERGPKLDRTLVVCVGDSITQGQISSNWVDRLAREHLTDGVRFVNAGVNGNLAWNVLQRLDDVIVAQPDVVTLLIGTNDIGALESEKQLNGYRRAQNLPAAIIPDIDWYEENLRGILDRVQAETHARIALLEIPPAGEDLNSARNGIVAAYNAVAHRLAAQRGITVLPLNTRLRELIPAGRTVPEYRMAPRLMIKAALAHTLLLRSWDRIAERNGMTVLTDFVHLSDTSGGVVAQLVDEFLADSNPAG